MSSILHDFKKIINSGSAIFRQFLQYPIFKVIRYSLTGYCTFFGLFGRVLVFIPWLFVYQSPAAILSPPFILHVCLKEHRKSFGRRPSWSRNWALLPFLCHLLSFSHPQWVADSFLCLLLCMNPKNAPLGLILSSCLPNAIHAIVCYLSALFLCSLAFLPLSICVLFCFQALSEIFVKHIVIFLRSSIFFNCWNCSFRISALRNFHPSC